MRNRILVSKVIGMVALVVGVSGCTGLFYFPSRDIVVLPSDLGLRYENLSIESEDGTKLHAWLLPGEPLDLSPSPPATAAPWALVVFFHGNAQNIAYHLPSVYWLPKRGVSVLTVDFRGYGQSEGNASVDGLQRDVRAAVRRALQLSAEASREREGKVSTDPIPVFVFSESLGGSTAISALADSELKTKLQGMIIEGAFSSYHLIAREKLQLTILTWPLAWPLSYLVTDRYNPLDAISRLSPLPLLIVHGQQDEVVPPHHSERLFAEALEPKTLWLCEKAGHLDSFQTEDGRSRFIEFLKRPQKNLAN